MREFCTKVGDSWPRVRKTEAFGQKGKEKGRLERNVSRSPKAQNSTAHARPLESSVCWNTRCRGAKGDDAGMDSRGPTVRDPECLPKKMAPLGDGGTCCPFEVATKLQLRAIPLLGVCVCV